MNLGKMNYWFGRVMLTVGRIIQPLNFLMLIYLSAQQNPLWVLLIPAGISSALFWVWFDRRHVVEKEMRTWFTLVPQLVEMQNDIKAIKAQLNTTQGDNWKGA